MAQKLDEKLNLVIPISRDAGSVYIHSTPIGRDAFEANFEILAATHASLFGRGGAYATVAPRVAALTLKKVGKEESERTGTEWNGADSLLSEIKRLSVVAVPAADGWKLLPVDAAIAQNFLDQDEWREAESAIVFFTSVSWLIARKDAATTAANMASAIGLSTTRLSPSEWLNSLPKSMPAATSVSASTEPGKTPISSIPS